jgi:hypothetical protein
MSCYVHCFYNKIRYGKEAGQQNNQHDDPILTFGYVWGSDIDALFLADKHYRDYNYQVKFTQQLGNKEWRGRIVTDELNYMVSTEPSPTYAHAYFFAVTPKKSTSLTSDTEEQVGGGVGDPTTVTVTVTNPNGTSTSTNAPPATTVQPID